jgi:putative redox protein
MPNASEKLTFTGSNGELLAGRLDLPAGKPRAYALFAHCFTCSKDIFAAARIAGELAAQGIAILRFDFTGLGRSEGEFANTNFSSNVEDLLKAADYLREHHEAPKILIGHSLGGAAILAAASDVPECKAIATIGAPADAEHVVHNFSAELEKIEKEGVAKVTLAGREFTIKKQFLEDLKAQSVTKRVGAMRKALLVFHAPRDQTVGVENAAAIFAAAKHPKSFVSLDDADHLLSRRSDAVYVARVLSAWVDRFIDSSEEVSVLPFPGADGEVAVAETGAGKFQAEVVARSHRLVADEPVVHGGEDSGPTPYDFLSVALGACTTMTLRMYAERKGLALERTTVRVQHDKVHADDCTECEGRDGRVDRFERELTLEGALDEATRKRLREIADKCPVHRTLEQSSVVVTTLSGEKP